MKLSSHLLRPHPRNLGAFLLMQSHLLWIITRWEQSGPGDGGRDNDADTKRLLSVHPPLLHFQTFTDSDHSHNRIIGVYSGRPAHALQRGAVLLNGQPSYLFNFWEIADSHQLQQSLPQLLSSSTSDAPCAPSTSSSSHARRRRHKRENLHDESPLVESINGFAECHQQLQFNSTSSRVSEMWAQRADRRFQRRAEFSHLARKYRKQNIELDPKSKRLSEFFSSEGLKIEKEIHLLNGNNKDTSLYFTTKKNCATTNKNLCSLHWPTSNNSSTSNLSKSF